MGKYNYDIKRYTLSNGEYQAEIKPKYFEHESIRVKECSIESLDISIDYVVSEFDRIYKFNEKQEFKRNVGNNSKLDNNIDWYLIEKEQKVLYKPFSTSYIKYHEISGKPLKYMLFENSNEFTFYKPSVPLTFLKKWLEKSYNEKYKNYQENYQRYLILEEEQTKWFLKYPKIVKNIQENYQNKKKDAIEIYFKLILDTSKLTVSFKKKYTLIYNEEDKSLIVHYSILEVKSILLVLRDKIYDEHKDKFDIDEDNHLKEERFNRFLNEVTLKTLSGLFISDSMNLISSIHFNREVFDEDGEKIKGYDMSLILARNQFKEIFQSNKKIDVEKNIRELNRDLILVKKLIPNGIYLEENNWINVEDNSYIFKENFLKELSIQEEGYISRNALEIISKFDKLEQLTINNQYLEVIPKEIFSMKLLNSITFKSNKIKEIPSEIKSLTELISIDFSDNEIKYFSDSLRELNSLKKLFIKNNNITNISKNILKSLVSSQLEELNLEGNPIFDNIKIKNDFDAKEVIAKLIAEIEKPKVEKKYDSRKSDRKRDDNRPLIVTEGKTDWRHLKKALERFQIIYGEYIDLNIEFEEYHDIGAGESTIDSWLKSTAKLKQEQRHIFMFDRDTSKYVQEYGEKEFIRVIDKDYLNRLKEKLEKYYGDKSSKKYLTIVQNLDNGSYQEVDEEIKKALIGNEYDEWKKLSNNQVYALCIPEIKDSDSPRTLDKICIEFYYKEEGLKTTTKDGQRLFFADEFEFNKENKGDDSKRFISKCGKFKTSSRQVKDGATVELTLISTPVYFIDDEQCKHNLLLSKNDFTKYIENEVEGFDDFDIENFRLIFDVIKKIVKD